MPAGMPLGLVRPVAPGRGCHLRQLDFVQLVQHQVALGIRDTLYHMQTEGRGEVTSGSRRKSPRKRHARWAARLSPFKPSGVACAQALSIHKTPFLPYLVVSPSVANATDGRQ
jgi:hypothetical protein